MTLDEQMDRREADARRAIASGAYDEARKVCLEYGAFVEAVLRAPASDREQAAALLHRALDFLRTAECMARAARAHLTARYNALPTLLPYRTPVEPGAESWRLDA